MVGVRRNKGGGVEEWGWECGGRGREAEHIG
jgi:hypothetical protein